MNIGSGFKTDQQQMNLRYAFAHNEDTHTYP